MITEEQKLKVKEIVADKLGFDIEDVKDSDDLYNNLNADSLDALELIFELEKEFDCRIEDEKADKVRLVSDIYELL